MFTRKHDQSRFRLMPRSTGAYPLFGGRPLRRSATGHPATVALALAAAIAATVLSLPSFAGSPVGAPAAAPAGEVRTTAKTDRLKPPAPAPRGGCDGVWGNEPLECLLQTA